MALAAAAARGMAYAARGLGGPVDPGAAPRTPDDPPAAKRPRSDAPLATGLHPAPPESQPEATTWQRGDLAAVVPMKAPMVPKVAYRAECILGKGSFGVVYKATVAHSGAPVAIKAVRQRSGEYNLEDQILRRLRGSPNIVSLLGTFTAGHGEEHMKYLVLEFLPDTLQRIIKHHRQAAMWMDMHYIRLYTYQLLRGLACLERWGVVHRDVKPANLLVDPLTKTLKICDFGTAKVLPGGNPDNQPYVCSRYYRAPELILSVPEYGTSVDLWSGGCVLGEMLVGQALFTGKDGVDQLAQIVEIRGTPTEGELYAMNPKYDASVGFRDRVEPLPWERVLRRKVEPEAVELLGRLLQYDPGARPKPLEAMACHFFDRLRQMAAQLDPALFDLRPEELAACEQPALRSRLTAAANAAKQLKLASMGVGLYAAAAAGARQ
mmetsp:Transcript_47663/g.138846  ORF Transcript_47663/g.138846 Transcript_47663/m.138846 type:complete len:435 (-) Transcript_47663:89-1393(-)